MNNTEFHQQLASPDAGHALSATAPVSDINDVNAVMARENFVARPINRTSGHQMRVLEAGRLMANVLTGQEDPFILRQAMRPTHAWAVAAIRENYPGLFPRGGEQIGLRETMSYSDFSALTVDVIDRLLYGYYSAAPLVTMPLVKKKPLRDFRVVARYAIDNAVKPFSISPTGNPATERDMVPVKREVPGTAGNADSQRVTYQPYLYQGLMSVGWEAMINDDLGIFNDMTQRLAISGRRAISTFITGLYFDTAGPNATLYNATFANLVTIANGASSNNPALSIQGLIDALTVLERQLDLDGQPIQFEGTLYLTFGPSLFTTAMSLMKYVQADISINGGTANAQGFPTQRLRVDNWVVQNMVPIQDKWIRLVCTAAGVKDTAWTLTYDPNSQARPSVEVGFLTGFDTPQIYQEVPNTMRVGGGVDPSLGNFNSMNQNFKGLLVMGGTQIDGRSTVASTGQGT